MQVRTRTPEDSQLQANVSCIKNLNEVYRAMLSKQRPRKSQELLGKELMPYYSERLPPYVDKPREGTGFDYEDMVNKWVKPEEVQSETQNVGRVLPWSSNQAWPEEEELRVPPPPPPLPLMETAEEVAMTTYSNPKPPAKKADADAWLEMSRSEMAAYPGGQPAWYENGPYAPDDVARVQ